MLIWLRDMLAVVILFGIYSLLSASAFLVMHAADVAFTEAAVGAGISSLLMFAALAITGRHEQEGSRGHWPHLVLVTITGIALVWGTLDLPAFGDPDAPAQTHVAGAYLERTPTDIDVPNVVTAVLASYRGYDTLGEVTVVFTAGLGVIMLLGRQRRRKNQS